MVSETCRINTDTLKMAVKNAVLYNKVCKRRADSHGLSIFFPDKKFDASLGLENSLDRYRSVAPSQTYYNFVSSYYNQIFEKDPTHLIGSISFTKRALVELNSGKYPPAFGCSIDLDDVPLINQIWFVIGDRVGQNFRTQCIDRDIAFDFETGNIAAEFNPQQYCIGGNPVPIYWDGDVNSWKNPDYKPLGSFAVKHNGNIKFLAVEESVNKKKPSAGACMIVGAWDSREFKGNVIPSISALNPEQIPKVGDRIVILYKVNGQYVEGGETVLDSLTITKSTLPAGSYSGAFYLVDVIGRNIWSYRKDFTVTNNGLQTSGSATNQEVAAGL